MPNLIFRIRTVDVRKEKKNLHDISADNDNSLLHGCTRGESVGKGVAAAFRPMANGAIQLTVDVGCSICSPRRFLPGCCLDGLGAEGGSGRFKLLPSDVDPI